MTTSGLTTFAWRNLWRNARRTLVLISVFTLGLFTMLLIQSFLQGWIKGTFESTYKNLAEPIQIHHPAYVEQPEVEHFFQADSSLMSRLQSTPGLKFAKRIRINATIQSEYDSVSVTVIGIDPQSEIGISFLPDAISQGEYLGSSPYPKGTTGLVMGEKLAKRLTTQLNRRVVLMAQKHGGGLAEIGLPIQGLFRHADPRMEESLVFMPIATADNWLNLTSGIHEIGLLPGQVDAQSVKALTLELQQALPELSVLSIWQRQPVLEATMELSDQMIWIWLGFVLLLMMLGMLNTLMMSLYERQQEFLLLYSLGLKPGKLRSLLGYEIGFILSLSTLLAMGLSILMIWSFRGGVELTTFAEGAAQFGMGTTLYLILDIEKWAQVLIATLITTAVFSLWPIWRATRHKALNVR